MRFSIFEIATLFLPASFLSLGIAEYFNDQPAIQWERFTIAAMDQYVKEGRRVLVLGAPQGMVAGFSTRALAEFDSAPLRQQCHNENYAMLKLEYTPWRARDPNIQLEMEWMLEHGGYKEPSLVRIESDGSKSAIKHIINRGRISRFLSQGQGLTRKSFYFGLFALTLVGWSTMLFLLRQKRSTAE